MYSETFPTHFTHAKDGYSNWIQNITEVLNARSLYKEIHLNCYWYPPWKTGALRQSRLLLLAPEFSKRFWRADSNEARLTDGLITENCFFATPGLTGARLLLLFPGLDAGRLQGKPSFSCSAIYCTSPTSTTSEIRRVVRGAASPTADDATVSALNQRSRVSFTAFLRDTIFSRHDFKSAITGPASTSIAPQGSNFELFLTESAAVTAVFSMLIPVSEKKFLCVNRVRRTKSCTHATAPLTCSWSIATPSSNTVNTGCNSEGPFTTNAVNWKT